MPTRGENCVLSLGVSLADSEAEGLLGALRQRHPGLTLQLVALKSEPNAKLLELIGTQTAQAVKSGSLLAEKPEVDLLLRIAGTTQIAEALERVGYGVRGKKVLIAVGERKLLMRLQRQASARRDRFRVLKSSPLTERELEAVETAALLSARRA